MTLEYPIVNLHEARFECTFGRGCDGICCRNGRPPIEPDELKRIEAQLPALLPRLRPEARTCVTASGVVSGRRSGGNPMLRVAAGWCVFFNRGCVLHEAGAAEGDSFRYKPKACALFPIARDGKGRWIVRQRGYDGEVWDLFCLDPQSTTVSAAESLPAEIALSQRLARDRTRE